MARLAHAIGQDAGHFIRRYLCICARTPSAPDHGVAYFALPGKIFLDLPLTDKVLPYRFMIMVFFCW